MNIYCDGAYSHKWKLGAWAVCMYSEDGEQILKWGGGIHTRTNNRPELMAFMFAIGVAAKLKKPALIHSDSQYVVRCFNGEYKRKKNLDIWERIFDIAWLPDIAKGKWIRGHSSNFLNNQAHKLASEIMKGNSFYTESYWLSTTTMNDIERYKIV